MIIGPVEVGPVAHGGHCVTRHDGRVIFVRHALPGEKVMIALTDQSHDKFWRGDAVEVITASPDRVESRCAISGPGLCGGCDFQHVALNRQRELKAQVLGEQLQRLAGIEWRGVVEAVPDPSTDGLGWRTRMRYHRDDHGRLGMRGHRSNEVIPLPDEGCVIADSRIATIDRQAPLGHGEMIAVTSSSNEVLVFPADRARQQVPLTERAAGRSWTVTADGFWQVHPGAVDTLASAVVDGLAPEPGERAFDLYCGAGLFTGVLADRGVQVWGIESNRRAITDARHNLREVSDQVSFSVDRVDRGLDRAPSRVDLVVLDPPRSGAGRAVVGKIIDRRPRAIAYVACDPAALSRDLGTARTLGYAATSIRAFDLFPMTHHLESVAILEPTQPE